MENREKAVKLMGWPVSDYNSNPFDRLNIPPAHTKIVAKKVWNLCGSAETVAKAAKEVLSKTSWIRNPGSYETLKVKKYLLEIIAEMSKERKAEFFESLMEVFEIKKLSGRELAIHLDFVLQSGTVPGNDSEIIQFLSEAADYVVEVSINQDSNIGFNLNGISNALMTMEIPWNLAKRILSADLKEKQSIKTMASSVLKNESMPQEKLDMMYGYIKKAPYDIRAEYAKNRSVSPEVLSLMAKRDKALYVSSILAANTSLSVEERKSLIDRVWPTQTIWHLNLQDESEEEIVLHVAKKSNALTGQTTAVMSAMKSEAAAKAAEEIIRIKDSETYKNRVFQLLAANKYIGIEKVEKIAKEEGLEIEPFLYVEMFLNGKKDGHVLEKAEEWMKEKIETEHWDYFHLHQTAKEMLKINRSHKLIDAVIEGRMNQWDTAYTAYAVAYPNMHLEHVIEFLEEYDIMEKILKLYDECKESQNEWVFKSTKNMLINEKVETILSSYVLSEYGDKNRKRKIAEKIGLKEFV